MNEQDLILSQKIEKREKTDTIIAYILIAILVGCIALILILKFTRKEEPTNKPDEYTPNYISLNEISTSLNSSTLANRYMNDGIAFNSNVNDSNLNISYAKEDVNVNLNMAMVGSELKLTITEENKDIITDIYKEVASIICMYYGNEEKYCRNTLNSMTDKGVDGIRFVNNEDTNIVYITTTRSFAVSNEIVYNATTPVELNENNYIVNMLDTKISNINVATSDTNIVFNGNIERTNDDTSNISVIVKLYDQDNNVLGENKQEYNETNPLNGSSEFNIEFILSDTLKLENINKYSIETIK